MTLDELIAWVSGQAAWCLTRAGHYMDDIGELETGYREEAATLTSVENALRRLAQIERDHGGEA